MCRPDEVAAELEGRGLPTDMDEADQRAALAEAMMKENPDFQVLRQVLPSLHKYVQ